MGAQQNTLVCGFFFQEDHIPVSGDMLRQHLFAHEHKAACFQMDIGTAFFNKELRGVIKAGSYSLNLFRLLQNYFK